MERQAGDDNKNYLRSTLLMTAVFLTASGVGYLFRLIRFPDTNVVVVYLLAVLITAWLTQSLLFGFIASGLATFLFNYFFAEPVFTFSVNDPNYIVTFATMTITALITGILTSQTKRSAVDAQEKEAETKAVYDLTNRLTDAKDMHDIAGIAAYAIGACFSCHAGCLCFNENNEPENSFVQRMLGGKQVRREIADPEAIKHRIEGLRTGYDVGSEFTDWPIYGRENILGVIRIPGDCATSMNEAQKGLLRSMIESTALAMDRFRSMEQRIKSGEEIARERYRANLLRSISHDIRTPLSGMMGTAEMLIDMTGEEDPRYPLALAIQSNAHWLHSLVENILNLTRLQDGKLSICKQMEAVEEVIGEAVGQVSSRSPDHEIVVDIPDELLLVPMDARLIIQVIINLLDNAIKHTASGQEISVIVKQDKETHIARFVVRDRGVGIPKSDLPNIFEMFYTSHANTPEGNRGIGLGLTICETIIKAHGGSIEARNRTDGPGAEFLFSLPLEETAYEPTQ